MSGTKTRKLPEILLTVKQLSVKLIKISETAGSRGYSFSGKFFGIKSDKPRSRVPSRRKASVEKKTKKNGSWVYPTRSTFCSYLVVLMIFSSNTSQRYFAWRLLKTHPLFFIKIKNKGGGYFMLD